MCFQLLYFKMCCTDPSDRPIVLVRRLADRGELIVIQEKSKMVFMIKVSWIENLDRCISMMLDFANRYAAGELDKAGCYDERDRMLWSEFQFQVPGRRMATHVRNWIVWAV